MPDTQFSVADKQIVITGASKGIGFALAQGFCKAGARVTITARNQKQLSEAHEALLKLDPRASAQVLDVNDDTAIRDFFAATPIDVLINNAGVEHVCESLNMSEMIWDKIVDTNLKGSFFCARAAAEVMKSQGKGTIINMCSLTSAVGVPGAVPYSASKSGLLGVTRALSSEWAKYNIRVNAIGPGYFQTDMTDVFYQDAQWCESMLKKIPMQRFGQLDDLVGTAIFLASEASAYMTGQVLYVDGGYLASI
ncbi:SDR family NAD(P)-dependent oxidoreductase [Celerinatantimonas diazotrophica]|uniref:Gluconate 5-dehydrogenase n=1 Tax=Celerinatantimonas diazotrophica TaxID=412034 RepID=A0A4R1K481_9GAMM|nr:SDR family oxidoreductase [Celerinatantimonas diazotrophica]TCK57799.1 gluconate 5-dehydrogenase [Celerinatantimonas diazotrophica]CAG9298137.1 Gluconate 5-dehydrogenase [Celerinatantimonas diazotrophica]